MNTQNWQIKILTLCMAAIALCLPDGLVILEGLPLTL